MKPTSIAWICIGLLGLAGCTNNASPIDASGDTEEIATHEERVSAVTSHHESYLSIPEELPEAMASPIDPGTRARCSFTKDEQVYIFKETKNLWLYNQSYIHGEDTQFLLNIRGKKIILHFPEEEPTLSACHLMYEDDAIKIYRTVEDNQIIENEMMYLQYGDLIFQVDYYQEMVKQRTITFSRLYEELTQVSTAITKPSSVSQLTSMYMGMRGVPVMDEIYVAFRQGVSCTGFFFCSPSSLTAEYEDTSVYLSVEVPEWNKYATMHVEKAPEHVEELEKTGEHFGTYDIYADYTGQLRYYIVGEDGKCIYLDGFTENYNAKQAAYIFDLVFTTSK